MYALDKKDIILRPSYFVLVLVMPDGDRIGAFFSCPFFVALRGVDLPTTFVF